MHSHTHAFTHAVYARTHTHTYHPACFCDTGVYCDPRLLQHLSKPVLPLCVPCSRELKFCVHKGTNVEITAARVYAAYARVGGVKATVEAKELALCGPIASRVGFGGIYLVAAALHRASGGRARVSVHQDLMEVIFRVL
jgi:hypothetical protein